MKLFRALLQGRDTAADVLTWLAGLAALLVAVTLPAGYFLAAYNHIAGQLESEVEVDAFFISRQVSANPLLWQYEVIRLQDLLERKSTLRGSEHRGVFDREGRLLADTTGQSAWPAVTRRHAVQDAGEDVGRVEVSRSLRPLLSRTTLVLLLGAGLGFLLFYILRVAPIRAVLAAEGRLQKANAALQASNADLQAFMYSAAHDMREPLVNLSGFAGELGTACHEAGAILAANRGGLTAADCGRVERILANDAVEAIGYLQAAVVRMDRLVNGLLQLSQATQQQLHVERVDPGATVAVVLSLFRQEINASGVKVNVAPLPPVAADPAVLELIFTHLLGNALKYRQPGRPGRIDIEGEETDAGVEFRVRDNGRGIAAADMAKLFMMFRRIGEKTEPGLGVGLAHVRTLVRRHGGDVRCASTYGEGSVFSFTLPARPPGRESA
ncbi:MAG: two-component sensor histidine kinase [Desulfobulbaceae bacterium]|nr:two-component sensor histidine kinase [Desulfobulbaceae bacterium]